MNRKGFTLVELIAMLVVISILMVIAIPNISGIIKKNRESISTEDINKMVGSAKTKLNVNKAKYPPENDDCVVMTLDFIDSNSDYKTGVNGGTYDRTESVIVVKKKKMTTTTSKYEYYVRLVEIKGSKTYVIDLVEYDNFASDPSSHASSLVELTDEQKFNMASATTTTAKATITAINNGHELCSNVTNVYK